MGHMKHTDADQLSVKQIETLVPGQKCEQITKGSHQETNCHISTPMTRVLTL